MIHSDNYSCRFVSVRDSVTPFSTVFLRNERKKRTYKFLRKEFESVSDDLERCSESFATNMLFVSISHDLLMNMFISSLLILYINLYYFAVIFCSSLHRNN